MRYLCSDIHGDYDKYQKALEIVGDDELIIIGDVIDRGRDGLKILLDTMEKDNITLMMGNHEGMMLDFLYKRGLYGGAWLNWRNGGEETFRAYRFAIENGEIDPDELEEYLASLPVSIDYGDVFLVHGQPVFDKNANQASFDEPIIKYFDDYSKDEKELCLWKSCFREGVFDSIHKQRKRKTTYFVGHVITQYAENGVMADRGGVRVLTLTAPDGSTMHDLDGGCAMGNEMSYLILYCLDTGEARYIK